MRFYFHLTNGTRFIADDEGIEISDLDAVRVEAIRAVRDFQAELGDTSSGWEGWRLEVVDDSGQMVIVIDLAGQGGSTTGGIAILLAAAIMQSLQLVLGHDGLLRLVL
jgi:hypothetical protein